MANKASPETSAAQSTLQRGKACLRCRKRKMRCDGAKPACQQCTRAKKGDACEYDDGKGKTRTQLLRENIVRLEQRIRELEDPEFVSPSVTLHDPHAHSRSASSSSIGSPDSTISASHSPFTSESTNSPQSSWTHLSGVPSPSPSPFGHDVFFDEHRAHFEPQIELAQMLLDILTPHRHQCGLDIDVQRIRDSLSLPTSEQRHPVLLNAMYLWACFVSRPSSLSQHEEYYLSHALDALRDALRSADKVIDVIQASCLLSLYFLTNGRILEGSYHASAAASLTVQCALDQSLPREIYSCLTNSKEGFDVKPFKTDERVVTFWQVYNLDRCWSVILRRPSIMPDGHAIQCPWPQQMTEYEMGLLDHGTTFQTLGAFFDGDVYSGGFSSQALRVKASALFARADYLYTNWNSRQKQACNLREQIPTLECTIDQFTTTLIPIHQLDATMPEDRYLLIAAHTLGHSAMVRLYQRFSQDDPLSFEKCLNAARSCVSIIKHITDRDYGFLDPILGPCWAYAAEILIRELDTIESSWPLMNSSESVRNDLGTLLYAMTSLSARFPIVAVPASKIQKRLAEQ